MAGRLAWYVLALLTICYALAYVDRQLINLLVDQIRTAHSLSDTQVSYIIGLGFALAYLVAAPISGRLVDVTNRRNLLIFAVCIWSACTALFGIVNSYWGLLAARIGVGISEACVLPIGWSLIADYFPPAKTPTALSVFATGQKLGSGLSMIAGGLIITFADSVRSIVPSFGHLATWQLAFILVGMPGILIAALLLTFPEPKRRGLTSVDSDLRFSTREAVMFLWSRRAFYGRIYLGIGMVGVLMLGLPTWFPSFLVRYHHMAPRTVGFAVGLVMLVFGTAGVLSGPIVARRFERQVPGDAIVRVSAFATIGMFLFCALLPIAPGPTGALSALAGAAFCYCLPTGIIPGAMQLGTPSRVRGVAASLYTFMAQLIGFGIGPTMIALVTDNVFGDDRMVGYSIGLVCCSASALACWLLASAERPYRRLLAEARHSLET